MKKVLVFNGYYFPAKKCGGPQTSICNVVNALSESFDFYIVAKNHDFGDTKVFENIEEGWNLVGKAKVKYIGDEYNYSVKRVRNLVQEIDPDIIWFSGVLRPEIKLVCIYISKRLRIPILFSPRGELSKDRVAIKKLKKKTYLFLMKLFRVYKNQFFHSTSDDETRGIRKELGIKSERIFQVSNISLIKDDLIFRRKIEGYIDIVFVSRIHKVKNLKYAIEVVSEADCEGTFDIYGPIESKKYWSDCLSIMESKTSKIKISYKGLLNPDVSRDIFQNYHAFLFPTINENFGHVIAESLANGCPVVLSKGTTPWDSVHENAGFVCDLNKKEEFVNAIEFIAKMSESEFNNFSAKTFKYYHNSSIVNTAVTGHKMMLDRVINTMKGM